MTTAWLVILIVLTMCVGLLALYTLGMGKRVMQALTERPGDLVFAPGGIGSNGPPLGVIAPALSDGRQKASTATGQTDRLVLFAESGCQPCAVLVADLARRRVKATGVELVAVVDDQQFGELLRDEWKVIVDPTWRLADTWHVTGTPHVTLLDGDGNVALNTVANTRKEVQRLIHNRVPHQESGVDH